MATKQYYVILCVTFHFICVCQGQSGGRLSMTLLDRGPLQSGSGIDGNYQYQCYVSHRDGTEVVDSYRLGYTRDGAANNPDPTDAVDDTGNRYPRWLVDLDVTNNNAFGVFGCEASRNGELVTKVSTVRMRSDAKITPSDNLYTQTVNVRDEGVEIKMKVQQTEDLQWIKDNNILTSANRTSTYRFNRPIQLTDAGIYECFFDSGRNDALHGLKLLLVRACSTNRWGPPDCFGICDNCYNGGVCDETNGKCMCPSGFKGTNCEIECGFNRFGEDCEFQCSSGEDNGDRCRGNLYCRPHPFGCTCISGFQGLGCQDDCPPGSYGASCLQTCHCASGGTCERETGICTADCDSGWSGSNCQVPDICPEDFYGMTCTEKCHCKDAGRCDKMNGACLNGICAPGYEVYANDYCEECQGNFFGLYCSNDCHCAENSCNKITGSCSGECTDQWVDRFSPYNCQTGLISAKFTTVNPGVSVPVHCTAFEGPGGNLSTLQLVLSRDDTNLDNTSIYFHNTTENDDTSVSTFIVDNVNVGEVLYCQLRYEDGNEAVISVNVTYFYKLPELHEPPNEVSLNDSSVTIDWTAWNESNNIGDGPVIGYIPYYKVVGGDWKNGSSIPEKVTSFTFTGLNSETNYSFSVAAVRPGLRGEGPKSPELRVETKCGVPEAVPMNLAAEVAGQHQEDVRLSWKIPFGEISCTSGVTTLTVYYVSTNLDDEDKGSESVEDPGSAFFILTGLQIEGNYTIQMTLETSGGESEGSDMIRYYVPRVPEYQDEPTIVLIGQDFLNVSWPKWDGVNGTPPVVVYRLYSKLSSSNEWNSTIDITANDTQEEYAKAIDKLVPDTEYDIRIAAVREGQNGEGPPGPVLDKVKTHCRDPDEGTLPTDVQAQVVGESQELVNVTWKLNEDNVDCSSGVDYFTVLYAGISKKTADGKSRWMVISDLTEGQSYSFNVTYTTTGGESPPSVESQELLLPVLPNLSDPIEVVKVDCYSVTVKWKTWTPGKDKGTPPIVAYIPYYKNSTSDNWVRGENVDHEEDKEEHFHGFENLASNANYTFGISVVREGYGGEGDRVTIEGTPVCPEGPKTGLIIGLTIATMFLVIVVIAVLLMRKKIIPTNNRKYNDGIPNNVFDGTAVDVLPESINETVGNDYMEDHIYGNVDAPAPVFVKQFESYMEKSGKDSNIIEEQFQLFKGVKEYQSDVGEKEENKQKNRFRNMVAYDHSRVVLKARQGDPHSDYYNANYIKDTQGNISFVACQGPNTASIDDFWRMIWQENVSNIVMLTNLVERGKSRCLQYWPTSVGKAELFGTINVKLQKMDQYADHEVRQLCVTYGDQTRIIRNWHYTTWPDMNIPDQPTPLIQFTRLVKRFQAASTAPLTVHCSAGVGRTGTFIALYTLMDVITTQERIGIFDYVEQMRKDRIMMIQTAAQYRFLHDCLLECYLSGKTEISPDDIALFDIDVCQEKLESEFKLLSRLNDLSENAHDATPEETAKCRFPSRVPLDKNRPFLQSQSKTNGTNYVNACFTKSHRKNKAIVATQSPLPTTVEDFWRLVYDWQCPLIVMLNQLDPNDQTSCQYWPDKGTSEFGNMTVELKEQQDHGICDYRFFELKYAYSEKTLTVHHFSLKSWENGCNVPKLISDMETLQDDYCLEGPPVVHCIDGVGRTGVFLTVNSEIQRMNSENKLDVFNTVRQLRGSSHHLVFSKDDYTLCHNILKLMFSREPEYANI